MHTRHRRRAVNRTVISFSLLLAAGCGATGSDGSRKAGALAGSDVPIGAVTEDVFVVGGAVAPGWASFSRVRAAAFAGTGDLALLDSDQRRLVVVGPDGNLRREVAGPGKNPGDLRRPLSLAALGNDRLVVYDSGHESFSNSDWTASFSTKSASRPATVSRLVPSAMCSVPCPIPMDGFLQPRHQTTARGVPLTFFARTAPERSSTTHGKCPMRPHTRDQTMRRPTETRAVPP